MLLPVEQNKHTDTDESELDHIYCNCSPNIGLCGTDITSEPDYEEWDEYTDDMCVVCIYFDENNFPCKFCGFKYE